jgi:Tfp pilus assembly protein PilF
MPLVRLSYDEALHNNGRPQSMWPRDKESQEARLRPFCLPGIEPTFSIAEDDLVFTIGSCFARNVEQHLIIEGFNVAVTRFEGLCEAEGVKVKSNTLNKFVAHSILNEIRWALEPGTEFPWDSIVEVKDGRFIDMQLAAGLMPTSKEAMLGMRRAVSNYMKMVKQAKVVIVTLGLAEAWYDTKFDLYTNTMPFKAAAERCPGRFELHVLEYNELLSTLREILRLLETYGHPDFRMLLTVSPVALSSTFTDRDALIANCYSKSVQRAAAEVISRENPRVDYLPSYESVTLSDRSVAWRDDQAHVSDDAVRVNVLRMQSAYTRSKTRNAAGRSTENARAGALAMSKRAAALQEDGDANSASDLFRRAAEIAPDEVLVHVRWGLALFKQQAVAQAAEELGKAMALGGRNYGIAYPLAKCLSKLNDQAGAEWALRMAIEDLPEKPGPCRLMAKTLKRLGRHPESVPFLEAALRLESEAESLAA